jgi:hypothetical protein
MFTSPIATLIKAFNHKLCELQCHYALIYTDTDVLSGQVAIRMSSNFNNEQAASLLGSLLEPGEKARAMLTELFKTHPLRFPAPIDPANPPAPDATPVLVEVPTAEAVEMVLEALLTNLQLKGAKQPSPIIALG